MKVGVEFMELEEESVREPEPIIGRMKWDEANPPGEKLPGYFGQLTLGVSLKTGWIEETEKQQYCGYWSVDNPHPFRNPDDTCKLCGARRA
jgi:hypothetical protein